MAKETQIECKNVEYAPETGHNYRHCIMSGGTDIKYEVSPIEGSKEGIIKEIKGGQISGIGKGAKIKEKSSFFGGAKLELL